MGGQTVVEIVVRTRPVRGSHQCCVAFGSYRRAALRIWSRDFRSWASRARVSCN
jgi:hypothetical protein